MAYWPRKRAKRMYARIGDWPKVETTVPLGFAGYKVGMTHIQIVDTNTNSKTKGQMLSKPVTILECPPLFVMGLRAYHDMTSTDVYYDKPSKNLLRKINVSKNPKMDLKKLDGKKYSSVKLICHTQPVFKKTPEIFELAIGGPVEKQLEFAKHLLGKEIKVSEVFKEGDMLDAIAVTKGKGFQGVVKRFHTRLQNRKNEQAHRKVGTHGQNEPGKIRITVPQSGQMGFQTRTEYNKRILKMGTGSDMNPKGGFINYGLVKGDYVVLAGSVPGPRKRMIRLRGATRDYHTKYPIDIRYVSLESKQGV